MPMPSSPQHWTELPNAPALGTALLHQDDVQDGQVRLVHTGPEHARFGVLLLRSGNQLRAFANRCAHFGVGLAAREEHLKFVPHQSLTCNVHYARYRWEDGICDRGDCVGERLLTMAVAVDSSGWVVIASDMDTPQARGA